MRRTRWSTMTRCTQPDSNSNAFRTTDCDKTNATLAVICEARGINPGAGRSSHVAATAFTESWHGSGGAVEPADRMRDALSLANELVEATCRRELEDRGCGPTGVCGLAAAMIQTGRLHWIVVGDTTIRVLRNRTLRKISGNGGAGPLLGTGTPQSTNSAGHGLAVQRGDVIMVSSAALDKLGETDIAALLEAGYGGRELVERGTAKAPEANDTITAAVLRITG